MNTYDDEMYKYLATPENYKAAKEISKLLSSIDERLKKEFKEKYLELLQKKFETIGAEVEYDEAEDTYFILKKDWSDKLAVAYEQGEYGIYIKKDFFDEEKINDYAKSTMHLELNSSHLENRWWLWWDSAPSEDLMQFNNDSKMMKILPICREKEMEEMVNYLFAYFKGVASHCDEINKMRK